MGTPRTWMDPEGQGANPGADTEVRGAPTGRCVGLCRDEDHGFGRGGGGSWWGPPWTRTPVGSCCCSVKATASRGGTRRGPPPQHGPGGAGDPRWRTPKGPVRMGDPWTGPPPAWTSLKGPAGAGTPSWAPAVGLGDPQGPQERDLWDGPGTPKPGLGVPLSWAWGPLRAWGGPAGSGPPNWGFTRGGYPRDGLILWGAEPLFCAPQTGGVLGGPPP